MENLILLYLKFNILENWYYIRYLYKISRNLGADIRNRFANEVDIVVNIN